MAAINSKEISLFLIYSKNNNKKQQAEKTLDIITSPGLTSRDLRF
jgi:hypothetical protein